MARFKQRRDKLRRLFRRQDADAILVTSFVNVTYLTGFTGDDSFLLVTRDGEVLVSDGRYTIQLAEECPGLDLQIRSTGVGMVEAVAGLVRKAGVGRLAIEVESMSGGLSSRLAMKLTKSTLVSTSGLVERLRLIKDRDEIKQTRHAIEVAERAFAVVRAAMRPEQTEKEVADQIEHQVRLFGGTCCSFPPIVAVGSRAALPHATPTDRRIGDDEFVLIDWGARGRLYVSDLTRLLVTGKISTKLRQVYGVVLKAQRQAISKIRPGVTLEKVDQAARHVIARAGYDRYFRHGLGHGIGLEIHEAPRLAPGQKEPLQAGMIVTVEPGIYLPAWGGIRIEDDVLVTRSGHEVLTSAGRELDDCIVP